MDSPSKPFRGTHPILFAAVLGAITGCAITLVDEFTGIFRHNSSAVIQMLAPGFAMGITESGVMRTALILLIETTGNALGHTLLFAVPTAAVVAIRRLF